VNGSCRVKPAVMLNVTVSTFVIVNEIVINANNKVTLNPRLQHFLEVKDE